MSAEEKRTEDLLQEQQPLQTEQAPCTEAAAPALSAEPAALETAAETAAEMPQQSAPLPPSQRPYELYEEPQWLKDKSFGKKAAAPQAAAVGIIGVSPAGFFVRAVAWLTDIFCCLPLFLLLARFCDVLWGEGGAAPVRVLLFAAAFTCCRILAHWAFGATVGKALLGLRVRSALTGEDATLWQCLFRETVGCQLSAVLFVGYFIAALRKDSRALHDLLADTVVIRR